MPNYATYAPQGYHGDWKRGAPLGRYARQPFKTPAGRLTLQRIRINNQGYDPQGAYWGTGDPLYWCASDDGTLDWTFRAASREAAKDKVRETYPDARFYN